MAGAKSSSGQAANASKFSNMDWAAIGNYASAGLDILQGLGKWAYAGDIGREKKKLLDSRANYNRKEIERAFKKNYSIQMSQYAQQLSDLSLQKIQAENQILQQATQGIGDIDVQGSSFKDLAFSTLKGEFNSELNKLIDDNMNANISLQQATQGIGDIDVQGSSFKDLAFSTLKGEFNSELNKLIDDNMNANISLANKAIEQERQVNLGQKLGHIQINAETDQMKIEGIGQAISGMTGGLNTYISEKAEDAQEEESSKNIQEFNAGLTIPDYNDKYFNKKLANWVATKRRKIMDSANLSYQNYGRNAMSNYY